MRKPTTITELDNGNEVTISVRAVETEDLVVVGLNGEEVAMSGDMARKFASLLDQAVDFIDDFYGEE